MILGQKLKILLKDNGMTQEDLAERLEVSRQAVGKWVNDKAVFFQAKQYQEIKNERLAFDDKVFGEFKKQRESRRKY